MQKPLFSGHSYQETNQHLPIWILDQARVRSFPNPEWSLLDEEKQLRLQERPQWQPLKKKTWKRKTSEAERDYLEQIEGKQQWARPPLVSSKLEQKKLPIDHPKPFFFFKKKKRKFSKKKKKQKKKKSYYFEIGRSSCVIVRIILQFCNSCSNINDTLVTDNSLMKKKSTNTVNEISSFTIFFFFFFFFFLFTFCFHLRDASISSAQQEPHTLDEHSPHIFSFRVNPNGLVQSWQAPTANWLFESWKRRKKKKKKKEK